MTSGDPPSGDKNSLQEGVIARLFIRRNTSRQSLRQIETFLRRTAVGRYAISQSGSAQSGYWPTIDIWDRRDLDRIRRKFPRLIDGWKEPA